MSALAQNTPELKPITTPYTFRAQFVGSLIILCPRCGHASRCQLLVNTWFVQCKFKGCKQRILISFNARLLKSHGPKRDVRPEDTTFPPGLSLPWKNGQNAHILTVEGEDEDTLDTSDTIANK